MDRPTNAMFFYVPARTGVILKHIIAHHVPAGSTIVSDLWRGYLGIHNINRFLHLTVNHSRYFVDPLTGKLIKKVSSYSLKFFPIHSECLSISQ